MITNTGKSILSKYLIGQAPAYASYIAVGCGPKPLTTSASSQDYSDQASLDFEMFRVPIISRGYVTTDSDTTELVLTAELPTEERYEITEVGVYSAGANPAAGGNDSRVLYSFNTNSENWELHSLDVAEAIIAEYGNLDDEGDNVIRNDVGNNGIIFVTNADNPLFINPERVSRGERSRFLNNMVVMRGDLSEIDKTGDVLVPASQARHIHLTGTQILLDKNSPNDEIRLAFSVINKDGLAAGNPSTVRIVVEFASEDVSGSTGQWARLQKEYTASDLSSDGERYKVLSSSLGSLIKSPEFSWEAIKIVKIYVSVLDNLGDPDPDYYVALDAIRFENLNTTSPLYGLTGYTVLKTEDGNAVVKEANTANLIEFRFAMDVV
jgi:hypothetical protein